MANLARFLIRRPLLQLHVADRRKLPTVHDDRVDLHGVDDRQGNRLREGATLEGSDEGDGYEQRQSLARVVHHMLHDHVHQRPPAALCPQGQCGLLKVGTTFSESGDLLKVRVTFSRSRLKVNMTCKVSRTVVLQSSYASSKTWKILEFDH